MVLAQTQNRPSLIDSTNYWSGHKEWFLLLKTKYSLARPFHKKSPCTPVIISTGVITVLIIENMAPTKPNIIAMETARIVNNHRLNVIKFGLRDISCLTAKRKLFNKFLLTQKQNIFG